VLNERHWIINKEDEMTRLCERKVNPAIYEIEWRPENIIKERGHRWQLVSSLEIVGFESENFEADVLWLRVRANSNLIIIRSLSGFREKYIGFNSHWLQIIEKEHLVSSKRLLKSDLENLLQVLRVQLGSDRL